MKHEQVQPLLALSAAGLLDADGERAVREHARACPVCAAQLETLGSISESLRAQPAPELPHHLLVRTQGRVAVEIATAAERRRSVWVAVCAGLFAWMMNLGTWAVIRWWRPELPGLLLWMVLSVVAACVAAPTAAAILAARRRAERRIS